MNPHQDGRANPVLIARPQKFFYRKDIHNELIFNVIAYYIVHGLTTNIGFSSRIYDLNNNKKYQSVFGDIHLVK